MLSTIIAPLVRALHASPQWLEPFQQMGRRVTGTDVEQCAAALNAANVHHPGFPVRFVEHDASAVESYETFIARTACVPTRNNLHDLLNGIVWLTYPQTKRRLNELHAQAIAQHGISSSRGALRDALTLFDENAALLRAPPVLLDALRRREWHTVFVEQRSLWQTTQFVVFGHALMEKLLQPRKSITAHVWVVAEMNDAAIAASLSSERLAAKTFLPLPVFGVPGWCADNEAPAFYDDVEVFRPLIAP